MEYTETSFWTFSSKNAILMLQKVIKHNNTSVLSHEPIIILVDI